MTVLDTSALVDYLLGGGVADQVQRLLDDEGELAAPDLLLFETLAVFRREALGGKLPEQRLAGAIADLGDVPVELFPSLSLRERAWQLRHSLTIADALFLALAVSLQESLARKDAALAAAAEQHASVRALRLS